MSTSPNPNDTTPDAAPRSETKDTDPGSPPITDAHTATDRRDTDPTWQRPSASRGGATYDSFPGVDSLLGGIGARPPVEVMTQAESAGNDAANYATVTAPAKAQPTPVISAAVIVATTEPMARAIPNANAGLDLPITQTAPLVPQTPIGGLVLAQAEASKIDRHQVTTVPGARRVRFAHRNVAICVCASVIAASVVGAILVLRSPVEAKPTLGTGTASVASGSTTPTSSVRVELPSPSSASPVVQPALMNSAMLTSAPSIMPPSVSAVRSAPTAATTTTTTRPPAATPTSSPRPATSEHAKPPTTTTTRPAHENPDTVL